MDFLLYRDKDVQKLLTFCGGGNYIIKKCLRGRAHKLKKVFITSGIIYGVLALVSIIFLFNNFTSSAETNFIFRITSMALICFVGTFPLLIATSDNIDPPTWAKVLLFIGYVVLEAGALFLHTRPLAIRHLCSTLTYLRKRLRIRKIISLQYCGLFCFSLRLL